MIFFSSIVLTIVGIIIIWVAAKKLAFKERRKILIGCVLVFVPLVISYIPEDKTKKEIDIVRAYLEPKLIIDKISPKGIKFHFEIENIGLLRAQDVKFLFSGPEFSTTEMETQHPRRDISPKGGKISFTPNRLNREITLGKEHFQRFVLAPSFHCIINKEKKNFISQFMFNLKTSEIKPSEYLYEYAERKEGIIEDKDRFNALDIQNRFDNSIGSFYFSFIPNKQKKEGITTFVTSKSKGIFYDPNKKETILKYKLEDGTVKTIKKKISKMNDEHFVIITWNEKEITFWVNKDSSKVKVSSPTGVFY